MKNINFQKWPINNNNYHTYLLILFLFLFKFTLSYVVVPFKYYKLSQTSNLTEIVYNLIDHQIIITLPIGTPKTFINLYPSMNLYIYYLEENSCLINSSSNYNLFISKSFSSYEKSKIFSCPRRLDSCSLGQDVLYLYEDIYLQKIIEFSSFKFYYGINNKNKIINNDILCGRLGFQIENIPYRFYNYDNFIKILKKNETIKSYSWYIHHYEKPYKRNDKEIYDGAIIFDIYNQDFFNDFSNIKYEDNYNTINVKDYEAILAWTFTFDKIYYNINDTKIELENKEGGLAFETKFIICPEEYFESIKVNFFDYYLKNNICFLIKEKYNYIYCLKDNFKDNINDFPCLNFKNNGLDRTFILTGKDLFKEYNNNLLFMIIFKEYSYKYWTLGNIFMKKFNFFFDNDKKIIGCFEINYNKKKNSNFIKVFNKIKWYLFIFIGIIIGFLLGKKIREKARKLRANELEDKYEYLANKVNNNISNYKEIKSQLYEYNSNT